MFCLFFNDSGHCHWFGKIRKYNLFSSKLIRRNALHTRSQSQTHLIKIIPLGRVISHCHRHPSN